MTEGTAPGAASLWSAEGTLRERIAAADAELARRFDAGVDAVALTALRARVLDQAVLEAWQPVAQAAPQLTLVAVGGFGRAELFPRSDIDLLLLAPRTPDAAQGALIAAFWAALWDQGMAPGHAVRTPAECVVAAEDLTVATALLESRVLAGDPSLLEAMRANLAAAGTWPPARFFEAKLAEQAARHARYHDTAQNLEPNLKEGPGGLRDYQLLLWLGLSSAGAGSIAGMARCGLLAEREAQSLAEARDALYRIRYGLHLVSGRAEERLLFERQRELAERFGFRDEHRQNLAVEQFMQGYYRAAMAVERVGERVIQRLHERGAGPLAETVLDDAFRSLGPWLDLNDPNAFARDPVTMLRAFRWLLELPALEGMSARLLVALDRQLPDASATLRANPDANAELLAILRHPGAVARALRLMARHGVLGALLPAFGAVAGRMQFDLFHVYTVDQHTLTVLAFMDAFAGTEGAQRFPIAHELWPRIRKPELLYLAGLFHDIAKGRGGDHATLGADDARAFCRGLDLSEADTDLVAWLVQEHLALSITAQKQDLTDPAVVHAFAERVQDSERLDYLYLLTVADINGTSARLWNSWRDRLLSELYRATHFALSRGLGHPVHALERVAETGRLARAELQALGFRDAQIDALWHRLPEDCFLRLLPEQLGWMSAVLLRNARAPLPVVAIRRRATRGTSKVLVYTPDRDGLFATLTAVLDRCQLSVVDARIMSTRDGVVLDLFQVLEPDGQPIADEARAAEIVARLRAALAPDAAPVRPARRSLSRGARQFAFPPEIAFADQADGNRTRMALAVADRPGLLAELAELLRAHHVRVHGARIATFGERAEDVFELSGEDDRPLAPEQAQALREALALRLGPADRGAAAGGATTPDAPARAAPAPLDMERRRQ